MFKLTISNSSLYESVRYFTASSAGCLFINTYMSDVCTVCVCASGAVNTKALCGNCYV